MQRGRLWLNLKISLRTSALVAQEGERESFCLSARWSELYSEGLASSDKLKGRGEGHCMWRESRRKNALNSFTSCYWNWPAAMLITVTLKQRYCFVFLSLFLSIPSTSLCFLIISLFFYSFCFFPIPILFFPIFLTHIYPQHTYYFTLSDLGCLIAPLLGPNTHFLVSNIRR